MEIVQSSSVAITANQRKRIYATYDCARPANGFSDLIGIDQWAVQATAGTVKFCWVPLNDPLSKAAGEPPANIFDTYDSATLTGGGSPIACDSAATLVLVVEGSADATIKIQFLGSTY